MRATVVTIATRRIGSLAVSTVGIGCNNFGRELDLAATRTIVHAALDAGITFFDTADSYGRPKTTSETLLGEVLDGHRDRVVIATKFGRRLDDSEGGASPAYVRAATEASLRRLRTDRIDLMQLHIPDPATPIGDTLDALGELVREGKVLEVGVSNLSATELREAATESAMGGRPLVVSTQAEFNLLHREQVAGVLAVCDGMDVALLPFRPLFHGLLTGKYRAGGAVAADSRIGSKGAGQQAEILSDANLARVEALTVFAEERGRTLLELAFAWLLAHPSVPSVIAGVTSARQVASNVAAVGWTLAATEKIEVDRLLDQQTRR